MKEKIEALRKHLADATTALEKQDTDAIIKSLEGMVTLADEMQTASEKTEETIEKLKKAENSAETLAKMQELTDAVTANKTAIEKFAETYSEDTEALAEMLTKMSRAKKSKQDNDEEQDNTEEKQPLSKKIFTF